MKKLTIKLLLVSFLVLPAMLSFAQDMSRLPDQNICLIKDYQPSAMESVNSIFTEDFSSGIFPPAGWTIVGDGQDNWSESATNNAGGEAPEAMLGWSPQFVGNTKLVTAEIATSGYSSVLFEMKHYVNDYAGSGYTLKVETTSDGGTTWNEVWSEAPAGAIGPETLQLLISNGDVGSDNFQVAFTLDGDSYQINYWYIDDIMLSEALANDAAVVSIDMPWLLATGTNLEPAATVNNQGSETATFDVTFEILDGATPIYSEVQTVTDLGAFEAASLTFPTWVAVTGNFVAEVTADLAGDENPENDMMTLDIEVVDGLVPLKPLYEMFTSATCAPCVPANENLTNILNANPDEYTLIKYQMNWPGSGDIYYTEEGGVRKDYYGVSWVPDLYIVGEQLDPAGSLTQEIFDEYLNELTALEIEITEAEIDEDLNITIAADLTPLADYAAGLTAHIVVVEKLTVGNVGSNGETEFYNVMHKMLPDAYGATLDALVTGQQVTLNQTFNMDETNMETPNDLAVVVFVQDDSDKSIVQSSMIDVDGTFAAYTATYTVQDEAENPIEGAEVFMEGNGTLITDALGEVVFEGVFPGNYEYAVEAAGFFPGNGEVTVIDQDIFETVTLVAPEFYWFEMFDVEPTDWTYHFTGWDYVYWYDGKMIIFRQSGTTEPLMLVSPAIDIDPANTIMFDLGEQGNAPAMVDFGTMTDPSDPSTFTLIETIEALPEWQTFEYDLSNLSNIETDVYFAWSLPGSDMCFFSIDNVILTEGGTSQYCDASTGNEDEYIGTVQCGDIDNTSGWQNGVADYTDLSTAIEIGGMLDITVLNGGGLYATDAVSLWVDWNDDFVFDVATEELVLDNDGTGAVFTGTISCPAGTMEGNHRMRIRMVYSAIPEPCGEASWGEVEDYTLTAGGGGITSDCEDFDTLTVGGLVADQLGGYWTTWSDDPGSSEDAPVSDMYSNSPSNSFLVNDGGIDLILELGDAPINTGQHVYSHYMYVPAGNSGYFNVQSEPTPGVVWVVEVFFNDDGSGNVTQSGTETPFTFTPDAWAFVEVNFDFESGYAVVQINGEEIYMWENAETIGGIDYFGWDVGGTPGAYYDDVCFEEGWVIEPPEMPDAPCDLTGPEMAITNQDFELNWTAPEDCGGGEGFFEGFEDMEFPPAGWIKISPDGGTGWEPLQVGTTPLPGWTGGDATPCPDGGDWQAYATWTTGGAASNDQWIVTPMVTVEAGYMLDF